MRVCFLEVVSVVIKGLFDSAGISEEYTEDLPEVST